MTDTPWKNPVEVGLISPDELLSEFTIALSTLSERLSSHTDISPSELCQKLPQIVGLSDVLTALKILQIDAQELTAQTLTLRKERLALTRELDALKGSVSDKLELLSRLQNELRFDLSRAKASPSSFVTTHHDGDATVIDLVLSELDKLRERLFNDDADHGNRFHGGNVSPLVRLLVDEIGDLVNKVRTVDDLLDKRRHLEGMKISTTVPNGTLHSIDIDPPSEHATGAGDLVAIDQQLSDIFNNGFSTSGVPQTVPELLQTVRKSADVALNKYNESQTTLRNLTHQLQTQSHDHKIEKQRIQLELEHMRASTNVLQKQLQQSIDELSLKSAEISHVNGQLKIMLASEAALKSHVEEMKTMLADSRDAHTVDLRQKDEDMHRIQQELTSVTSQFITQLEDQKARSDAEKGALTDRVLVLEQQLADIERASTMLQADYDSRCETFVAERDAALKEAEALAAILVKLQKETRDLVDERNEAEKAKLHYEQRCHVLEEERNGLEGQVREALADKTTMEQTTSSLSRRLERAREEVDRAVQDHKSARAELDVLQSMIEDLREERNNLEGRLSAADGRVQQLLSASEKDTATLQSQLKEKAEAEVGLRARLERIEDLLQQTQDRIIGLESELSVSNRRLQEIESESLRKDSDVEMMRAKLADVRKRHGEELVAMREQMDVLDADARDAFKARAQLLHEVEATRDQIAQWEEKFKVVQHEKESVHSEVQILRHDAIVKAEELAAVLAGLKTRDMELQQKQEAYRTLLEDRNSASERLNGIQKERDMLRSRLEEQRAMHAATEAELHEEIKQLQHSLASEESVRTALTNRVAELEEDIRVKGEEQGGLLDDLQRQKENIEGSLKVAQQEQSESAKEIQALKAEVGKLQQMEAGLREQVKAAVEAEAHAQRRVIDLQASFAEAMQEKVIRIEGLEKELGAKDVKLVEGRREVEDMQIVLKGVRDDLAQAETARKELEGRCEALSDSLAVKSKQLENEASALSATHAHGEKLEFELAAVKSSLDERNIALQRKEYELVEQRGRIDALNVQLKESEQRWLELTREIDSLREQLQETKENEAVERNQLKRKLDTVMTEATQQKNQLVIQHRKDLDEILAKVDTLRNELTAVQNECEQLRQEREGLISTEEENLLEIARLQAAVSEGDTAALMKIQDLEVRLADMDTETQRILKEKADKEIEIKTLKDLLKEVQKRLVELEEARQEHAEIVRNLEGAAGQKVATLKQQLDNSVQGMEELRQEQALALENMEVDADGRVAVVQEQVRQLEEENGRLTRQGVEQEEQMRSNADNVKCLEIKVLEATEKLAAVHRRLQELAGQEMTWKDQLLGERKRAEQLSHYLAERDVRINDLERTLDELTNKCAEADQLAMQLRADKARLADVEMQLEQASNLQNSIAASSQTRMDDSIGAAPAPSPSTSPTQNQPNRISVRAQRDESKEAAMSARDPSVSTPQNSRVLVNTDAKKRKPAVDTPEPATVVTKKARFAPGTVDPVTPVNPLRQKNAAQTPMSTNKRVNSNARYKILVGTIEDSKKAQVFDCLKKMPDTAVMNSLQMKDGKETFPSGVITSVSRKTLKTFGASLTGAWLIYDTAWVTDSFEKKGWLDEASYRSFRNPDKSAFEGKSFFIADSYKNQPNIKKSLKVRVDYIGPLIACAKGRIVDSCEEAEVVMIGDEDKG